MSENMTSGTESAETNDGNLEVMIRRVVMLFEGSYDQEVALTKINDSLFGCGPCDAKVAEPKGPSDCAFDRLIDAIGAAEYNQQLVNEQILRLRDSL